MKKVLKYFLIFLSLLVVCITLVFVFISPITKYILEENCLKWTGRHITIGSVKVKPFNGSIYIKDLKIYEANGDSVFFNCHDIYLRVSLLKAFDRVYQVEKIKIDKPQIRITQNGNTFNFDDIIQRFSPPPGNAPQPKNAAETQYYVNNILINDATITYNNIPIHNVFRIRNLNFSLPEIAWNKPESKLHLDFVYGTGGNFNIDLETNRNTLAYNLALQIDKYDLSQYHTPLNTIIKTSSITGSLNSKLRVHGKFNNAKDISIHGYLNLSNLVIKDLDQKKVFALRRFSLDVDSVDVQHNHYDVNHLLLDNPYVAYNIYPNGNNINRMFVNRVKPSRPLKDSVKGKAKDTAKGKTGLDYSNIFTLLASSVKDMAIDFLRTNYHADSIAIRNGQFAYNDYTPNHNFHYNASNINLVASELNDFNSGVIFHATAKLGDSGKLIARASLSYNRRKKAFSYKVDTLKITDISPVAKYVLEKNSVKWTGRRITTGKIKVNFVKGSIFIKDIKIYEADSVSTFFACHDVYLRVNLMQMFDNVYHVEKIKIDKPEISIVQNGNTFNFDDLIKHFSSPPNPNDTAKGPDLHYKIDSIFINHGNITYNNVPIHNIFELKDLNFRVPQISWDNPVSTAHLDFIYGIGGFFNADMDINRVKMHYNLALQINNYDLSQYYAPLNSFINISSLKGRLNANLRVHGKFNNPKKMALAGNLHLNDVEIRDSAQRKFFALKELAIGIDSVNIRHNIYSFGNILLDRPYIVFDYFPHGNNISQMIKYTAPAAPVKDTATGEIKADYSNIFTLLSSSIKLMAVDFVNTNYHTDSVIIRKGQFIYNDYTLNSPFHYNISNIDITTGKISAAKKSVQFNAFANLADTGRIALNADISLDLKNMLINYEVSNLRVSDFNPYTEFYVGTPFLGGYMKYQSTDSVINKLLKSTNQIHIEGLKVGKKTSTKPVYSLPVKLAVSLLKDDKGNVNISMPATGNLDDPNYKIGPLFWRVLKDILLKAVESPFKLLAKLFDRDPKDMKQFEFDYLQRKLEDKQYHKLDDVCKVLNKKPDLQVEITQVTDSLAEKDELALYWAKKQYYLDTKHIVHDSLTSRRKRRKDHHAVTKISTQDTLFNKYLDAKLHLTGNELMPIQDKCIKLTGDSVLTKEIHKRMMGRNQQVLDYLVNKKALSRERVKVIVNTDTSKLQDIDQPEFEINYTATDK